MRETGSRKGGILGLWVGTAVLLGATAVDGNLLLVDAAEKTLGPIRAFAGGTANRVRDYFVARMVRERKRYATIGRADAMIRQRNAGNDKRGTATNEQDWGVRRAGGTKTA